MKLRLIIPTMLTLGSLSLSASAQQQPWLADRRYGEGIGIRSGALEFHPGIAGEVGYDSNYFQRAGDGQTSERVIPALRFRLTPSISLSTLSEQRRAAEGRGAPPKLNFRAGAALGLNALVATDSANSDALGKQSHIDATGNFSLDILPQAPWGADLYGQYQRMVEASNSPDTASAWDRDLVVLGAGVVWRPGGGLFDWRLGYELQYNYFEREAYQNLNNAQHAVKTRGRWRFLPRTAFLYDASLGFIGYSGATTQANSQPVRARLGLNGLITNHFAVLAMAGWGASFYETSARPTSNFDSLIAQGELKWFILPQPTMPSDGATVGLSSIALGYTRDFQNSYLGDYYQRDRGYLGFSYFLGGQVLLSLNGGVARVGYPPSYFANGTARFGAFAQTRVDGTLFGEYRLSDSIGINTTLSYDAALGDRLIPTRTAAPQAYDNLKFSRFEAYLGVRWFM
ncbi:MAG: hypothetical protein OZ921_03615 [Sorangiineae bacterium]|nr:hypothetical protein [Polyangiaceae bacterium]MEB2321577.1 hypothetical protein [Sorangiineae bacterium]